MKGNQNSKGKPSSEKQKAWTRENKPRAKHWVITNSQGETLTIFSLRQFCIEHGLSQGNLVSRGKTKGFTLIGEAA